MTVPPASLSALDGTNGFTVDGIDSGDQAGFSVAAAGDVNGDGFADVIVGAAYASGDLDYVGEAYVVFGGADWTGLSSFDPATLDGTNGFRLEGAVGDERAGFDVSSAGDVNGDGFGDLIIGTRYGSPTPETYEGYSYVVFGKADWSATSDLNLAALDGTDGFRIDGTDPEGYAGWSVSGAGDVNGDGFADVVVGAPYADAGAYGDEGISYVFFGKADWSADATFDLATIDGTSGFSIEGGFGSGASGYTVGPAGDVNGDGFDDVVVTALYDDDGEYSYGGAAYVVFGKADWSATASVGLTSLDGTDGFRVQGDYDAASQIASARGAGDVNGDGFGDLVIGSPIDSGYGGYDAGAAYVIFGKADWTGTPLFGLAGLAATDGFRLGGVAAYDQAGRSVDGARDVDGDGFDDIVVGAPGSPLLGPAGAAGPAAYGATTGEAYVVFDGDFSSIVTIEGDDNDNSIDGTAGDDVIFADAGDDTVQGLGGNDFLNGGAGADTLTAGDGDDTVDGAAGDDLIIGGSGAGNDTYMGGLGIDEVSYASTTAGVTVDLGAGTATGPEIGTDTLISIEAVVGGAGQDTLTGDGGANTLDGGAANDSLLGGAGDDVYVFDAAYGSDTITDTGGSDAVRTAIDERPAALFRDGDDFVLTLDDGSSLRIADHFAGTGHAVEFVEVLGDFPFTLNLLTGHVGTPDSDIIVGTTGADTLIGNGDFDVLFGDAGDDSLDGGASEDDVSGGAGDDHVFGGDDDDELVGNAGDDTLDGGDGWDDVDYDSDGGASAVTVDLSAGTATDTHGDTDTLTNIEAVLGTALGDHMMGDAGKINFLGRGGDDTLEGADGDDVLDGGAGGDTLDGGAGWDGVTYYNDEEDGGTSGVVVNLELGAATDGFGDTDTLIGIEWVSGTAQADTLTGADSTTEEVE